MRPHPGCSDGPAAFEGLGRAADLSRLAHWDDGAHHPAVGADMIGDVTEVTPPAIFNLASRMLSVDPLGPLIEGSALNGTVLANTCNMDIGVSARPDVAPAVEAAVLQPARGGTAQEHAP